MTFKDFRFAFAVPQILAYDEDVADVADVADDVADVADDTSSGDDAAAKKKEEEQATFTQDQLNKILAEDRRKEEAKRAKVGETAKQMEARLKKAIADNKNSEELRAALANDLEDLRASQRSAEEQRAFTAKKAKEAHESEVQRLADEAKQWESLYKRETIERTLTDAAVVHDAYSPNQLVSLLRDKTEMKEEKDSEGNPTGRLVPLTALEVKGEDGSVLTTWKPPTEVVELMKNDPTDENKNLFRNAVIAGIGGGTAASGVKDARTVDGKKISMDDFAKRFEENPESLGLAPKHY